MTIHKAQGSEYPAVVMPLYPGPRMLMNRNLLYTAVTRAKQMVVLIGDPAVMNGMIDNTNEAKRYTSLDLYLSEGASPAGSSRPDDPDPGMVSVFDQPDFLSDDPVASNMVDPGQIDPENPFATFA